MVGLQDRTSRLPWDNFVSDEIDSNTHLHIDRFRESEWPNIVRELAKEPYNIVLPEGLEPHWVAPGKAVYWSELIVREVVEKEEDGISKRVLEDVSHGWFPVGEEHGLPANNASTIAHYLNKGFRLRPPEAGVSDETLQSTFTAEALELIDQEPEEETEVEIYVCRRHGNKSRTFKSWKGYIAHCTQFKESLEAEPPEEVQKLAMEYPYFCFIHNRGFSSYKSAWRHQRTELSKGGKAQHPTTEQMKLTK